MEKEKFLITGANGFVAKYFIEYLNAINQNCEILGLDISDKTSIDFPNFKYKKNNLNDKNKILAILKDFKPNYILHLASVSSVAISWQKPVESFVNNTNIFLNLIEAIRELNLDTRILSIGSSEEYGNYSAKKMPLQEIYELHPNSPYAVSRVSQELLSKVYAKDYGVNIIMTRSFNHVGPRQQDIFVVSAFIKQLVEIAKGVKKSINVGNIDIIRDFLDIRDVVNIYYKLLKFGRVGEIYNVCSGNGTRLSDIIKITEKKLNIIATINIDKSKIRPDDNMVIIGDNFKLKKEFNWSPNYTLEQTIDDMIDYWQKIIK